WFIPVRKSSQVDGFRAFRIKQPGKLVYFVAADGAALFLRQQAPSESVCCAYPSRRDGMNASCSRFAQWPGKRLQGPPNRSGKIVAVIACKKLVSAIARKRYRD